MTCAIAFEVEAARGDVGRDERRHLPRAEPLERALAGALRHVAVHRGALDAVAAQLRRETVGAALCPHEHEREPGLGVEQLDEAVDLVGRGDRDEAVVDLAVGVLGRQLGGEPRRVERVRLRERADLTVERRGEEHRLALRRQHPDDLLDLRLEAHVEHPVGLVEDEDPDRAERNEPAVREVGEPARRRDDDVRALELLRLRRDRRAAVGGRGADPERRAEQRQLLGHLQRKLAGRDEDERRRHLLVGGEPLDDWQPERERLARSGRRLAEDVAAGDRVGDDEGLDTKRCGDAAVSSACSTSALTPSGAKAFGHVVFDSFYCWIREPRARILGGTRT